MAQNKGLKNNLSHRKGIVLDNKFVFKEFIWNLALVLLSSVLFFLMFPNFLFKGGISLFGFIALAPFFYVLITSNRLGWLYSFIMGAVSYALFNYWLYNFNSLSIFIVTLIMGIFYLLFFFVFKFGLKRIYRFQYLYLAVLWVLFEYLKTFGFFGYSFGIVGYSQFLSPVGRLASVGGVRFVSFLLVFFSAFFAFALKDGVVPFFKKEWKVFVFVCCFYLVAFVLSFVFAPNQVVSEEENSSSEELNILLVQHCTNNWKAGYSHNLETLKFITEKGLEKNSLGKDLDFIIWSETAFIPGIYWHTNYDTDLKTKKVVADFQKYVSEKKNIFITGNSNGRLADENLPAIIYEDKKAFLNRKDYNSAVVYKDGVNIGFYNKQKLVPFIEYFPLRKYMPLFAKLLDKSGAKVWAKGTERKIFIYNDHKFAINICFEDAFSSLTRKDVKNGANFLVNLTNDYWSKSIAAQMQHLSMSVFRAIELGVPVIRATNSGMSGVILPNGKLHFVQPPFRKQADITNIPVNFKRHTIYYYLGDWFLALMILSLVAIYFINIKNYKK